MEKPDIWDLPKAGLLFLQGYADVQSFVSRTEGSYVFLALTGFVIQNFGFAPAIATVVATQALASVLNHVFFRIIFNTPQPYEDQKWLSRNVGSVTTLIFSFMLFAVVTSAPFENLYLASGQFLAGIIITFIGGLAYKGTHEYFDNERTPEAVKILVPGLAALAVVAISLLGISYTARFFGVENYLTILEHSVAEG